MNNIIPWTLQDIWNNTLLEKQQPVEPRNYIRASEIGGSFLDRYYKMKGEQFTDPYNARTLRVFEVGNLYEWLVRIVLLRSGLLMRSQTEVKVQSEHHLDVVGHLDFIGGGKPDFTEAEKILPILESLYFPTRMLTVAEKMMSDLEAKFPNGLAPLLYEIKSINSMVFWRKDRMLEKAYDHHIMQNYTYVKGTGLPEGRILYISKDDLTVAEFAVIPDEDMEEAWQEDVQKMTYYIRTNTLPPVAPYVLYNEEREKFEANWMVARSPYFKKIISTDKEEWQRSMGNLASRANARLKKEMPIEAVNAYVASELRGGLIKT